jgi:poly(glycerol-phosphate) alpha-glucosyltransferase
LIDRHNKCQQFDTRTALITYFLDCLNEDYWSLDYPNVFILDRSHLGDQALLQLKKPAYTVFHLHNAHTADAQDPEAPLFNNNYEFALNVIDGYDAVVSATHKQTADVRTRLQPKAQLFTIPVGVVSNKLLTAPHVPLANRQFGKMVVFARIAWEKHLDDLVRAIGIVHREIPQVTLDLYGYPDPGDNYKAQHEVEAVIAEYDLADVVTLKGYTTKIDEVQNNAMMYGLTSRMEGFNLAIMEAISHGLISFSYDVNYGPNEIVADGVNGAVVPYGDYQALAAAILQVLRDPALAEKYIEGAYQSAERYSEAAVWDAWKKLLSDAQASWATKIAAMPGHRRG